MYDSLGEPVNTMLNKMSQLQRISTKWFPLYVESKVDGLLEITSKVVKITRIESDVQ